MTPVAYVALIREEGPRDFIVTFPDVPEAITQGDNLDEARANAHDALATALAGYLKRDRPFPPAAASEEGSAPLGTSMWVTAVDPKLAARARLIREMKARGMNNVALAKLMGRDEKAVRLILSGKGATLDKTLEALRAVGVRPALAA
jgi:antitoxin HicB